MAREKERVSLRDQQRAFTRERLLDGAAEVFTKIGYVPATIDDIVEAAGASRATFYLHFLSKPDVIAELGHRMVPEVNEQYRNLDDALVNGTREDVRAWMASAVEWTQRHQGTIAAVTVAQVVGGKGPKAAILSPTVEHMPQLRAHWPDDNLDGLALRISLLQVQFRSAVAFLSDDWQANPELFIETMTDIWHAALTPK